MADYRILYKGGEGEITEKKSRFIAHIAPCGSEEEAAALVLSRRKTYYDARHHCFAFILDGERPVTRYADDGEPQGTAGRPMLEVLQGEGLHQVCAVVTRYFGGTLLGTGGLSRAYSGAVKEALKACTVLTLVTAARCRIRFGYSDLGRIQYMLAEEKIDTEELSYGQDVEMTILVPEEAFPRVSKKLADATGGALVLEAGDIIRYGMDHGRPVIF